MTAERAFESPETIEGLRQELLNVEVPDVKEIEKEVGTESISSYNSQSTRWNEIYCGDNSDILKHLLEDQDMKEEITLVYIDPPFAADHDFESRGGGRENPAYQDTYGDKEYVQFLRERLVLLRELLSEQGSIYLHIGEEMMAHVKILMDEVFGSENYQNIISRQKCHSKNSTKSRYGNVQDFILFYSKSDNKTWERPTREPTSEERERALNEYRYTEEDSGRRYMKVPIHAPGTRDGETGKEWNGMAPPEGKHWTTTPAKLDQLEEEGKIAWSSNGNPRKKVYYDNRDGIPVTDMWSDLRDYYNQMQSITGYPTEKNEDLLKRIVEASSDEDDIVLDAFMGSGTTLAAADKLNRKYIGIDKNRDAVDMTQERLKGISGNSPFKVYSSQGD